MHTFRLLVSVVWICVLSLCEEADRRMYITLPILNCTVAGLKVSSQQAIPIDIFNHNSMASLSL